MNKEIMGAMGFAITEFPDGHYEAVCGNAWLSGPTSDLEPTADFADFAATGEHLDGPTKLP